MARVHSILTGQEVEVPDAELSSRRASRNAAREKTAGSGGSADLLRALGEAFGAVEGRAARADAATAEAERLRGELAAARATPPAPAPEQPAKLRVLKGPDGLVTSAFADALGLRFDLQRDVTRRITGVSVIHDDRGGGKRR